MSRLLWIGGGWSLVCNNAVALQIGIAMARGSRKGLLGGLALGWIGWGGY